MQQMSDNISPNINREGKVPSAEEITGLETEIGHKVPKAYIDLISDPQATFPSPNSFPAGKNHTDYIINFFPFSSLKAAYDDFNVEHEQDESSEDFPILSFRGSPQLSGFLPFAKTHNTHVCLAVDERRDDYGAVYLWHQDYDSFTNKLVKLAPSFPEFMETVKFKSWVMSDEEFAKEGFKSLGVRGDDISTLLTEIKSKQIKRDMK